MFEIGSEFWSEKTDHGNGITEYLPNGFDTRYTLCGRTALDIIIEDLIQENKIHNVYMPSYCCFTMIEPFKTHGINIMFYDVFPGNNGIEANYEDNICDTVFLIDYFGYINKETIHFAKSEKAKGKTIIYDRTHSLFCSFTEETYFDYVFGSFKKWMGINAGFASKIGKWNMFPMLRQNEKFIELRNRAFDLKADFIDSPNEKDKNNFLRWFGEAAEILENDYKYYGPDDQSTDMLNHIDTNKVRQKRVANAMILIEGLDDIDGLQVLYRIVNSNECPLFVPVCVEGCRDELRKYLIRNDIYMPVHGPVSNLHVLNRISSELFRSEMSCVCDQRYDEKDMYYIVDKIKRFFINN